MFDLESPKTLPQRIDWKMLTYQLQNVFFKGKVDTHIFWKYGPVVPGGLAGLLSGWLAAAESTPPQDW